MKNSVLKGIKEDIEAILFPYVNIKSNTGSVLERDVEPFFKDFFQGIPYFKKQPEHYGFHKIKNDIYGRSVCWGLIKGCGSETVILIHHYDVVGIEDFKTLKVFAYSPEELEYELLKMKEELSPEARADLESGDYIFGRGTADMKGGGAVQLALFKKYSELESFTGNILLIAVPDEENLSAGMLSGVFLLKELKEKYKLNYLMMINSEPHQRISKDVGVLSEGSVGKMMPFFYVKGFLNHVGKVFEGFNPVSLITEIVRKTDLNLQLCDFMENEASPPPTWLYLKERKYCYDVSLPPSAAGCLSILTLNREPASMLETIRKLCEEAFTELIEDMNKKYKVFRERIQKPWEPLPWKSKVVTFKELYDEAFANYGQSFTYKYEETLRHIEGRIRAGELTMIESNFFLVEAVYDFIDDLAPRVVIGLAPPYYPNAANMYIKEINEKAGNLSKSIMEFSLKEFNQQYSREHFFTGISDMSYTSISNSKVIAETLKGNMPLFRSLYNIPIEEIEELSIPCMNIGPWGKEYHKLTERVLKEDLFQRTPKLIHYAVSELLDWE